MAQRSRFRDWVPNVESGVVSFLFEVFVVVALGLLSVGIAWVALLVF